MSKGLIVGIIVKNQVLCKEYTYINLGIYTLVNNWAARCCLCRVTNDKSIVVDISADSQPTFGHQVGVCHHVCAAIVVVWHCMSV